MTQHGCAAERLPKRVKGGLAQVCTDCDFADAFCAEHAPDYRKSWSLQKLVCPGGALFDMKAAVACIECKTCDAHDPLYGKWLANHTEGKAHGSCKNGTHQVPCPVPGCTARCKCCCSYSNRDRWRYGKMRRGALRGEVRAGAAATHWAEKREADTVLAGELRKHDHEDDGSSSGKFELPSLYDVAMLVCPAAAEALRKLGAATAASSPTVARRTDPSQYTRLQHALRDICVAVVKLACPAGADTITVKNAWANDVARAVDDEHFRAERDDAGVGRSLMRALQIVYESAQGSVVRHTVLGVLRTLAGFDDTGGRLAGQQTRVMFRATSGRAVGDLAEPWNITEQMWENAYFHAAVLAGGHVPTYSWAKKTRGSPIALVVGRGRKNRVGVRRAVKRPREHGSAERATRFADRARTGSST